jgi:hypothetical protein
MLIETYTDTNISHLKLKDISAFGVSMLTETFTDTNISLLELTALFVSSGCHTSHIPLALINTEDNVGSKSS